MKLRFDTIKRVGIELEGLFLSQNRNANYHGDGSVVFRNEDGGFVGEVVSEPMGIGTVNDWVLNNYPDQINNTCGCHIHVSFNSNMDYMNTMTQNFYDYFIDGMEKWGNEMKIKPNSQFWLRLEGKNQYCKRMPKDNTVLIAECQKRGSDYNADRYYQLNHCWSKHKTLECRLLPIFKKPAITISGILEFLNICENFITQTKIEEDTIEEVIEVDNEQGNNIEVICL